MGKTAGWQQRVGRGLGRLDVEGQPRPGRHDARGGRCEEAVERAEIDQRVGDEHQVEALLGLGEEGDHVSFDQRRRRAASPLWRACAATDRRRPVACVRLEVLGGEPGAATEVDDTRQVASVGGDEARELFGHVIAEHIDQLLVERLGEAVEIGDEIVARRAIELFADQGVEQVAMNRIGLDCGSRDRPRRIAASR